MKSQQIVLPQEEHIQRLHRHQHDVEPEAGAGAGVLPVAAFVGAVLAVTATYYFARAAGGRRTPATLILAGVAIGSFLTALQTFLQQQSSDRIRVSSPGCWDASVEPPGHR